MKCLRKPPAARAKCLRALGSDESDRTNRVNAEDDYRLPNVPYHGEQEVTIYRSVPADVAPEIRPGDWVSLTRRYVAAHGRGKILSKRVPAMHVAWAGTDMNEWFYAPQGDLGRGGLGRGGLGRGGLDGALDPNAGYQTKDGAALWAQKNRPFGLGKVSDLCTGKDLGRQVWDYTCLAPPGYQIRVEVGPSGNYVRAALLYPGADVQGQRMGEAGSASGVRSGTDLVVGESFLGTAHRGRGLGVILYEALFSHAFHRMGVKRIVGALHSTSARRVHEKLAAKHGLKYSAAPNVEKVEAESGEYDEKWGEYAYPLAGADTQPIIAYHGTDAVFDRFVKSKARWGSFGRGFYFTDTPAEAAKYGKHLMRVRLTIARPASLADVNAAASDTAKLVRRGFDSVVHRSSISGLTTYVVFRPEQVELLPAEGLGKGGLGKLNGLSGRRKRWAYHGTPAANLPAIAKEGLTPSSLYVWFSEFEDSGFFYASSMLDGVVLRFPFPTDAAPNPHVLDMPVKDRPRGEYVSEHTVPPDQIQVWDKALNRWKPLASASLGRGALGKGGLGTAPGNGKLVFRGITQDEHDFIVTHRYIQSNERYCIRGEGTCFATSYDDAESYVNYGRTNPIATKSPTYVLAVSSGGDVVVDRRDGYPKVAGHVASDRIKMAIRFNPDGTMERGVWSPTGFSSRSKPKPHPWRKSPAQWGARPGLGAAPARELPLDHDETWNDGTRVVFRKLPFPYRRKPFAPRSAVAAAKVEHVPLDTQLLHASQRTVTDRGVAQYQRTDPNAMLPTVFAEPDGTYTVSDGHHRIAAAWLRGDQTFLAWVIHVPASALSGAEAQNPREQAYVDFVSAVRHVWKNAEFVLPVVVMLSDEPTTNPDGFQPFASITFNPQGIRAIGSSILRRAPQYTLRVSDRFLALPAEQRQQVLIHEAVHLGYPKHDKGFRDLCREKGGTVSERALEDPGIKAEKKIGSRFQVQRVFTDEREAKKWAMEQQRAEPGSRWRLSLGGLDLTTSTKEGPIFETGRPVTFTALHNTERAPTFGSRFGQDIEPAGRYYIQNENPGDLPRGWEKSTLTFQNPLVLRLSLDQDVYGPQGWKARLVAEHRKKRRALSCHLRKLGHDGIVTVDTDGYTREIVDLSGVRC